MLSESEVKHVGRIHKFYHPRGLRTPNYWRSLRCLPRPDECGGLCVKEALDVVIDIAPLPKSSGEDIEQRRLMTQEALATVLAEFKALGH